MIDEFCRCLAKGSSPLARKDRLCLDVGEPSPPSARFALVQAGPLPVLVLALATPRFATRQGCRAGPATSYLLSDRYGGTVTGTSFQDRGASGEAPLSLLGAFQAHFRCWKSSLLGDLLGFAYP